MLAISYDTSFVSQVGCDEAGRGCLAGPVVAAAVLFPNNYANGRINDSKQIKALLRNELAEEIKNDSIGYAFGICTHEEIDKINILQASILAMHRALDKIKTSFDLILVDGNKFNTYQRIAHRCIIKGDSKYLQIAAASILAKTYRDQLMTQYAETYPQYVFHKNKGYASKEHIAAIEKYGYSPIHRKTFKLKKFNQQLFLFD